MPGPDFPSINANISRSIHAPAPGHPANLEHLLPYIMYAAQLFDAANSARSLANGGQEKDPVMQPFSHGGFPTMAAGFGLTDLLRGALLHRASQGTRNTGDAAQTLLNLTGIAQTDDARNKARAVVPPRPLQ